MQGGRPFLGRGQVDVRGPGLFPTASSQRGVLRKGAGGLGVAVPGGAGLSPCCPGAQDGCSESTEGQDPALKSLWVGGEPAFFFSPVLSVIPLKGTKACVCLRLLTSKLILTRDGEEEVLGNGEILWLGTVPWEWV